MRSKFLSDEERLATHITIVYNLQGKLFFFHPIFSLLPNFKGLNVHQRVIEAKSDISGCSVHLVRSGVDEGPIIGQMSTNIETNDSEELLAKKVLKLEHVLYPVCLKLFSDNLIDINGFFIRIYIYNF